MFNETPTPIDPGCARDSITPTIVLPRSAMLVAAQMLLDDQAEGSSDRIRIVESVPSVFPGAESYRCAQGRGQRPLTVVVPAIQRFYKASVLSILKSAGRAQCKLLPNGMPGTGMTQIVRWGDSGECEIRWSRSMVEDYLRQPRFETMDPQAKVATAGSYGAAPALIVNGEARSLPPIAQCEKVWRALHGESVVVSSAELDLIEPALCCGLRLVSAPNLQRVGLLDAYVLQLPPHRQA